MLFILGLIIIGLIAGLLARFLVPGRDPMGLAGTILLGIAGSFVGGFLFGLVTGGTDNALQPAGLLGSIIGAVIVLVVYNAVTQRGRGRVGARR